MAQAVTRDTTAVPNKVSLTNLFKIGAWPDSTTQGFWDGKIGALQLFRYDLTTTEIQALAAADFNGVPAEDSIYCSSYSMAGQVVAFRVAGDITANNGRFYVFTDHLGSTSFLRKSDETVLLAGSTTRYLPYGGYRGAPPTQTTTDRDFTGQKENRELGLVYYNARFYVPAIGRFASADSIVPNPANPQSLNRYSYVGNSPLTRIDPTGHRECDMVSGDCDGRSTPPPPQPVLELQDWEIQLMAMVAYFETQGIPQHTEVVIWTIINRLTSPAFPNSAEELLVGNQYHIALRDPDNRGVYQNGIFAPYKDPDQFGVLSGQALSDAAFSHYSSQDSELNNSFNDVKKLVSDFNAGVSDPTGGAVYFAHGPDGNWATNVQANLEAQAEIDGLSDDLVVTQQGGSSWIVLNNIYDPPFGRYPFSGGYCGAYGSRACEVYSGN